MTHCTDPIYIEQKEEGPNIEPWGTPHLIWQGSEQTPLNQFEKSSEAQTLVRFTGTRQNFN